MYLFQLIAKLLRGKRRSLPAPVYSHCVKDSRTRQVIAEGDAAHCRAFARAFGECYVETVNHCFVEGAA